MIPILYAANETVFTHNGIGLLPDCISCEVTEERNGIYEAVIQYPITGLHYSSILEDCIVKIKPNELSDNQLFRVYKTSKPIDGIVTINLEHISYTLNGNPVAAYSVSNVTATAAIASALSNATFTHGFSAYSDIVSGHSTSFGAPLSVRAILGGTKGSILDTWGGEYEFDNFVVKLHAARGTATDIVIEYGKNLTDIKQEKNITGVYTALFPYAKYITKSTVNGVEVETEHLVTLTEKTLAAPTAANYAHSKALIKDFSADFERDVAITENSLRAVATAYLAANPIDTPSVNITVSFVQLWQTAEYANIAPLERVKLCDTVTVRFSKLGVTATAKVIKTVYDCLLERYKNIELGTAKSNFGQTVNNQQTQINELNTGLEVKTGALYQAILNATAAITGQTGGYVVTNPAENPQEILIMNTDDMATATKIWRWNLGGLGYSDDGGVNYETAITMDGAIVADFITTGVLNAGLIKTGRIQAENGTSYIDVDEDEIVISNGSIGGFTATSTMLSAKGSTLGTRAGIAAWTNQYCSLFAGGHSTSDTRPYVFAYIKLNSYAGGKAIFETFSDTGCTTIVDIFDGVNGDTIDYAMIDSAAAAYNGTHKITLLGKHSFTYPCTYDASDTTGRIFVFPKFYVHGNGTMHAENAEISGSVLGALSVKGSVNKLVIADGKYTGSTGNTQGLYWTAENTDISLWKGDRAKMETDSKAIIHFYKDGAFEKLTIDSKDSPLAINSDASGLDAIELQNNTTVVGVSTAYAFNSPSTLGGMQIKIDNNIACIIKSDGIYDATGTSRKLAF